MQDIPAGVGPAGCVARLDQVRPLAKCLVRFYPLQVQLELQLLTRPLGMVFDEELKHRLCCSEVSVQGAQWVCPQ